MAQYIFPANINFHQLHCVLHMLVYTEGHHICYIFLIHMSMFSLNQLFYKVILQIKVSP
jgi:hypothetical protein